MISFLILLTSFVKFLLNTKLLKVQEQGSRVSNYRQPVNLCTHDSLSYNQRVNVLETTSYASTTPEDSGEYSGSLSCIWSVVCTGQ